jgi:hypothetical protein
VTHCLSRHAIWAVWYRGIGSSGGVKSIKECKALAM